MRKILHLIAVVGLVVAAMFSAVSMDVSAYMKKGAEPAVPKTDEKQTYLPETPQVDAKWTVMVYLDGDNNLESAALDDLAEMEAVGSRNGVNVVVLMDTQSLIEGTHWYFLGEGNTHVKLTDSSVTTHHCDCELVTGQPCPGELNMGDGATLTYFVKEAMKFAPADNYMLVLWDHGGGWYGVCWDDSSELFPDSDRTDRLTIHEAAEALCAAGLGADEKLAILGFDACMMSMVEIAYEFRGLADYMLASVTSIPFAGWDYTPILRELTADPQMDPVTLGQIVVDSYVAYYDECAGAGFKGMTWAGLSLVDLSRVTDLVLGPAGEGGMNAVATELMTIVQDSKYRGYVAQAIQSLTPVILTYGQQFAFVDIGNLLEQLGEKIPDLQATTGRALDLLAPAVVYVRYVENDNWGTMVDTCGMSVYFPIGWNYVYEDYGFETYEESEAAGALPYYGLDFASDTLWDEMILGFSQTYDAGT
ncbi:MAG: clostripain-related cysteine peptidase [Thermoplasmata archaeon]